MMPHQAIIYFITSYLTTTPASHITTITQPIPWTLYKCTHTIHKTLYHTPSNTTPHMTTPQRHTTPQLHTAPTKYTIPSHHNYTRAHYTTPTAVCSPQTAIHTYTTTPSRMIVREQAGANKVSELTPKLVPTTSETSLCWCLPASLSCPVLSCPAQPCPALPFLLLPYSAMSCSTLPCFPPPHFPALHCPLQSCTVLLSCLALHVSCPAMLHLVLHFSTLPRLDFSPSYFSVSFKVS